MIFCLYVTYKQDLLLETTQSNNIIAIQLHPANHNEHLLLHLISDIPNLIIVWGPLLEDILNSTGFNDMYGRICVISI